MIGYHEILKGLRKLDLEHSNPVLAHASLSAFGQVRGGADTVVGALLASFESVIMPAFTYMTMLVPKVGPQDNAIAYNNLNDANLMAEFFQEDMPADRMMGLIPETLRKLEEAERSTHPILSFVGVNASDILATQTLEFPLAPIQALSEQDGWVLLLGVDHNTNTTIHLGELLAGRRTFTRWALTPEGVVECSQFPACSKGFPAIAPFLDLIVRKTEIGEATVQAIAVKDLLEVTKAQISQDARALLCDDPGCQRCNAVRNEVTKELVVQ
ncbi:MAG: AAC(3) family N-acetyltransferase [Anaerolineales bacterium]|nr:AAC(3) family N-acetyltransferase [Anaerolineales bacterium]